MKNEIQKFLEFNGKNILFISKDGQYWVAIKPICEALNVNYNRQFQNLKSDKVLNQLFAEQQIVAADGKLRNMVSLPEKFVYGWIFQIRSDSPELIDYKWQCYQILFDYFQGAVMRREKVLRDKTLELLEIRTLENKLKQNTDFIRLNELNGKQSKFTRELKKIDQAVVAGQMEMWESEFETSQS